MISPIDILVLIIILGLSIYGVMCLFHKLIFKSALREKITRLEYSVIKILKKLENTENKKNKT